jgi:uncharacterized protein YnzC (UPF0291/DUF896 family)
LEKYDFKKVGQQEVVKSLISELHHYSYDLHNRQFQSSLVNGSTEDSATLEVMRLIHEKATDALAILEELTQEEGEVRKDVLVDELLHELRESVKDTIKNIKEGLDGR